MKPAFPSRLLTVNKFVEYRAILDHRFAEFFGAGVDPSGPYRSSVCPAIIFDQFWIVD
jgi:hypothetical protein